MLSKKQKGESKIKREVYMSVICKNYEYADADI